MAMRYFRIELGAGRKIGWMPLKRTANSQASRTATITRVGTSRYASDLALRLGEPVAMALAHRRVLLHHRIEDFLANEMQRAVVEPAELGCVDHFLRAWPRQIDRNDLLDASGPRRHHHHFVAEQDGLVDGVGDK